MANTKFEIEVHGFEWQGEFDEAGNVYLDGEHIGTTEGGLTPELQEAADRDADIAEDRDEPAYRPGKPEGATTAAKATDLARAYLLAFEG